MDLIVASLKSLIGKKDGVVMATFRIRYGGDYEFEGQSLSEVVAGDVSSQVGE